jgi:hypothetical protein
MSWNVMFVGKPENVAAAIEAQTFKDQSGVEYGEAKPHLAALVRQNFAKPESGYTEPAVKLYASGSGSSRDGEQLQRSCSVQIEIMYGALV